MARAIQRWLAVSSLLIAGAPALAQERAPWGAYVSADVATTDFRIRKSELDRRLGIAPADSSFVNTDSRFSLAVGFRFSPMFAAEVSYVELGDALYEADVGLETGALKLGSRGPAVSLLGGWPLHPNWSLEGRFGMYFPDTVLHWYDLFLDPAFEETETGGANPGLILGAGLVGSFGRHWSVRFGFDYFTHKTFEDVDPAVGVDSSARRWSIGLSYQF